MSRSWLPAVRFHIFGSLTVNGTEQLESFATFLEAQSPTLGSVAPYVHSFNLDMQERLWATLPTGDALTYAGILKKQGHPMAVPEIDVRASIVRISKHLQGLRSLTLKRIVDTRPIFGEGPESPLLSMCCRLNALRLTDVHFCDVAYLVDLLQVSPELTSVSLQDVTWPTCYGAELLHQWITRPTQHKSRAAIRDLEFTSCFRWVMLTILQGMRTPSFELRLRTLAIDAFHVPVFSTLLEDGSCSALETLRLQYGHSLHEKWGEPAFLSYHSTLVAFRLAERFLSDRVYDLSALVQLRALHIMSLRLLDEVGGTMTHAPLAQMLSKITSPVLSSITFTQLRWIPSWEPDDEGWSALDSALAKLFKLSPSLRVSFMFVSWDTLHPDYEETVFLENTLRNNLSTFLMQGGWAEVAVTCSNPGAIYGDRVTILTSPDSEIHR